MGFLKYPAFFLVTIITLLALFWLGSSIHYKISPPKDIEYGVTFSPLAAQSLGLDPEETYQGILDDLKVKNLRIPVYWDQAEKSPGKYNFQEVDKLLDLAREKGAKVTLVLGYKVPRWPECFAPDWTKDLPANRFQDEILTLLQSEVNHFKTRPEVVTWQIENEPLLKFGDCRMFDENFLKQEVEVVRKLDSRPIILTDSGERSWWIPALKYSDIFGTTLYRTVWDEVFGYIRYPIPPFFYPLRAYLTGHLLSTRSQDLLISELQAEPWPPAKSLSQTTATEQAKMFPVTDLKEVTEYAAQTNIKKQYFWGAEWWYFMKKQGHPEYWNFAKTLF